ncbi:MAG: RluA family pseudouridine synthase [Verrucomicrobiota bacterium]
MSEQASIPASMSGAFRILGETPDLLAVEKPPFLLIHPSKPGDPVTLWDRLKELLAYEIAGGGQVSLINRLDRETSGIVLVAKNAAAARVCSMTMARGEVKKEYLAIVMGWPEIDQWEIREPILRLGEVQDARIWLKRGVHPGGAPSHTAFRVLKKMTHPERGPIALIHCIPFTGKTHQIRIHLAHSGYPVVGDKIYGPSEECYLKFIETGWTAELAAQLWLPRHALHSCLLEIDYLGQSHNWISPLAEDLAQWLQACG